MNCWTLLRTCSGIALQEVLEGELDATLGYDKSEHREDESNADSKNYRDGYSKKTVKTKLGEVNINVPRDRSGEFEPQILSKYQHILRKSGG